LQEPAWMKGDVPGRCNGSLIPLYVGCKEAKP
jgi:hypothetical protein